jgi:hypothetical protein
MIGYARRAKINSDSVVSGVLSDVADDPVGADDAGRGAAEKIVREGAV